MKRNTRTMHTILALAVGAGVMLASGSASAQSAGAAKAQRNAYFGDLHVHTGFSTDAFILQTRTTPDDAYRYAKGAAIDHASGYKIQINKPLDFLAVTDHSEYMGVLPGMLDPNNPLSKHPLAKEVLSTDPDVRFKAVLKVVGSIMSHKPIPEFVDQKVTRSVWQEIIKAAEKHYQPGTFTTFIGYEWSSNGPQGNQNLHRNVIFRGSKVFDEPYSTISSIKPEDLWTAMEKGRADGMELLAIPHNANLSGGLMFALTDSDGKPLDKAYAERRMRNEPLQEITQLKGTSDTHPALSTTDEFANFEINEFLMEGEATGSSKSQPKGSYIRDAYRAGLVLQDQLGANPFKFGVVGDSDTHNTGGNYEENRMFGGHGSDDGIPERRLGANTTVAALFKYFSSGGLVGVWAEENRREPIFDALKRKETFATTGPRIRVRFFGGWEFTKAAATSRDMAKIGYAKGVPMGGDLGAPKGKAPSFMLWAVKDPDSGNLDRIQIIKGWSKAGQSFEKVYNVAWSGKRKPDPKSGKLPPVGNTVDLSTATYKNTIGSTELSTTWIDPEFDPTQRAFYYARVLEIPTPRWSTFDAVKLGVAPPAEVPATIQERAFASPIWYTPGEADLAKARAAALTAAGLEGQGAKALTDDEIRALIVGKTMRIKNTVTGAEYAAFYGADGKRTLTAAAGFAGLHGGAGLGTNPYEIKGGRLSSSLDDGSTFSSRIFKLGDRYVAARSDEAGYANYELTVK
jgi:Protein of unknown function (DUF3604)